MAIQTVSVQSTATAQNLGTLVAAALGMTISGGGTTSLAPAPRFSQLTIQADPANGSPVRFGGAGVTASTGVSIAAGNQAVLGFGGEGVNGTMASIWVVGAGQLNVVWLD